MNPYAEARDENGYYIYDQDIEGIDDRSLDFNLLEEMENTDYSLKNLSLKPMLTLDYKPISWLKLFTQFSMQIESTTTEKIADKETYFIRKYEYYSRYFDKGVEKYFLPGGGLIQNWNTDMSQYQWKLQGEIHT